MDKLGINHNIYKSLILRLFTVYSIYTFTRLAFYLIHIELFEATKIESLPYIFFGGLQFDTTAILYINGIFILSQILPFKFVTLSTYQKVCNVWFLVTNAFFIMVNFIDLGYYPLTLKRTTAAIFSEFANEQNIGILILRFLFVDYYELTLLYVLFVFLFVFFNKKLKIELFKSENKLFYFSHSVLMCLTLWLVVVGIRGGFTGTTRPIAINNAGKYVQRAEEMSIVLNTPFCIFRTLNKPKLPKFTYFTDSELQKIYTPIHHYSSNEFNKKNVVIFIIESLSTEFVGFLNKNNGIKDYQSYTPFIDSLMSKSLVFENSFANGSKSIDALPSVVSSIPSLKIHYVISDYSSNTTSSLAKILKNRGYETAFFHGAPNGSMGFDAYMNLAGFEKYFGKNEYNNDNDFDGYWGIWDEHFFQFMAKTLTQEIKEPFLSVLFSLSSHHPFIVPEKYKDKFPKGNSKIHQTVGYMDYSLKKFFEFASQQSWFNNTIFVITADHVGDGYYPEYLTTIGRKQVPIFIFDPQQKLVGINSHVADQIDIMPTILGLLQYDSSFFAFGQNLLDSSENHFAIHSINDNSLQLVKNEYVLQFDETQWLGMYHLKKDRWLKENLLHQNILETEKIKDLGKAFIQHYNNRMVDNELVVK